MKYLSFSIFMFIACTLVAQDKSELLGRWDLTISKEGQELPSWLEVIKSGNFTLTGRFVYASGSARPISEIEYENGYFRFSIPPQWERGPWDMQFHGKITEEGLSGTMVFVDGQTYDWSGVRAPDLEYVEDPEWGEPMDLIRDNDLSGWKATGENQWVVEDGILKNPKTGSNLMTEENFRDFKLHVEFRYPEGSNSGIYLRGRYEVQIADNYGEAPSNVFIGGVYGFLTPNQMAAKKAGEWQTYDITLIGRRVTIVLNGMPIIQDQIIPGITGGALDSKEGEPGPILLQGDHGPVEFRNMTLTPLTK